MTALSLQSAFDIDDWFFDAPAAPCRPAHDAAAVRLPGGRVKPFLPEIWREPCCSIASDDALRRGASPLPAMAAALDCCRRGPAKPQPQAGAQAGDGGGAEGGAFLRLGDRLSIDRKGGIRVVGAAPFRDDSGVLVHGGDDSAPPSGRHGNSAGKSCRTIADGASARLSPIDWAALTRAEKLLLAALGVGFLSGIANVLARVMS